MFDERHEQPIQQRRDGVAEDVSDNRECADADQQHVRPQGPEVVATQGDDARRICLMPHGHRHGDDRSPRMAHHNGAHDPELLERLVQQVSLFVRRPNTSARALAVAEPGTVEDDDPVARLQDLRDATRVVVVSRDHVAVDENDGAALAAVAVMQSDAIHLHERALGGVPPLCTACHDMVGHSQGAESDRAGCQSRTDRRWSATRKEIHAILEVSVRGINRRIRDRTALLGGSAA